MDVSGPQKMGSGSIASIANLSVALSVRQTEIESLIKTPCDIRYSKVSVAKRGGGVRIVYDPSWPLRLIQKKINDRIFKTIVLWPDYLYGSIPTSNKAKPPHDTPRDYVACAERHCKARSILKIDIENFYENIHRDEVNKIFRDFFKYPEKVASCLTEICCYEDRIVQGALTSSYLAALCLYDTEHFLVQRLRKRGLIYTRLVDDITVSSKIRGYNFANTESHIRQMLLERDLPINASKLRVIRAGELPLVVHGLIVDGERPRLPSAEISKIKASVHNIKRAASTNNFRTTFPYRTHYYRVLGRVNRLSRLNNPKHKVFLKKIENIHPMPRKLDIERVEASIDILTKSVDKSSVRYRRRYHITRYRISLISKSFRRQADRLLAMFKTIEKPRVL